MKVIVYYKWANSLDIITNNSRRYEIVRKSSIAFSAIEEKSIQTALEETKNP